MTMSKRRILVTSALPYANGPLHLGHIAGAYLPADVYVRFQKLKGNDVIYICGTDEHGVPITITAEKEKKSPQEIVDKYHKMHKASFRKFGIHFDNFSRTSNPIHHRMSQDFFLKLYKKDLLVRKKVTQFYCKTCEKFLPDRYVEGTCYHCHTRGAKGDQCETCGKWLDQLKLVDPVCKICGSTPEIRNTWHWFLPLGKFQKRIEKWILSKNDWRDNVINFCKGWFKEGLEDRAVTRDLYWGVKVPLEEAKEKVLYVWFEAPIGYISSTIEWSRNIGEPDKWKLYWHDNQTEMYHFIGKDNIVFHAIVFPIVLIAYGGYNVPANVIANEFLNIEGEKLSTSRNYAVWLDDYLEKFEPGPLRYYLTAIAPETRDSDFSWSEFRQRNDSELAGILGNFFNRTFEFIKKYFENRIPQPSGFNKNDKEIFEEIKTTFKNADTLFENFKFREALRTVMDLARKSNKYFNDEEPWVTVKENKKRCGTSIYVCTELARNLAILMTPFMPYKALDVIKILYKEKNIEQYGQGKDEILDKLFSGDIPVNFKFKYTSNERIIPGKELGDTKIIFPKLDKNIVEKESERLEKIRKKFIQTEEQKEEKQMAETISIEEFKKIDLRVAKIKSADRVKGADKLLKMIVDIGGEERQIVAGIAEYYNPEDIVGKLVVVVTNLKPAKIRGEISNGMLLAALHNDDLVLVTTDGNIPTGSEIS